ncbi:MAG: 4-hydroxybenzoate octaprenyltransferase [Gammaproteobacteria bacterium]|nr:MAG: 4-hydroxybenzoate octaprenyltransferase [Gammaproteobacteria bacterium]RLA54389.1 MAG: 4-hydroxybenzoate octaprenyltransferase [Gammaproteobacteria bacterium]
MLPDRAIFPGRTRDFLELMRFDKPVGTLLLLWPTLSALWLAANGVPSIDVLVIFTLGVILMRAAGCVINDYADRHVDGLVQRTRQRPIVDGRIQPVEALLLFVALCLIAFLLVLSTNNLTIMLSMGGVAIAIVYPFMKRHTHLPQVVLGAAWAWAIPMAFAAQTGTITKGVWVFYVAIVLWTVAFDTFYAMVDREDDKKAGIKSTAILFDDLDLITIGVLQASTVLALALTGKSFGRGSVYFIGVGIIAGLFLYQQMIARHRQPEACFKAFRNNNWVGLVLFAAIVIDTSDGLFE